MSHYFKNFKNLITLNTHNYVEAWKAITEVGVHIVTTSLVNNLGIPSKINRYVTQNLAIWLIGIYLVVHICTYYVHRKISAHTFMKSLKKFKNLSRGIQIMLN